jgi:hypothetical protein
VWGPTSGSGPDFLLAAGRFETIEAVNYAAAQELVQKINAEKGGGRYAYIPDKCASREGL